MKYFSLLIIICCLLSCGSSADLYVDFADFPEAAKLFLAKALDRESLRKQGFILGEEAGPAAVVISFESRMTSWQESEQHSFDYLPLSRICMVYPAEVWEGKTTVKADSISFSALIPLHELSPPYVACKADGFDVSDPNYPFVYEEGIRFSYDSTKLDGKKIAELWESIEKKLKGNQREARPRLFRIAAGGDLMLARGAEDILLTEGPEGILGGTAALVYGADLSLVNLEGAVTSRGEKAAKSFTFRFDPRVAPALKNAGFDAVLFANNHAFDFGITGFVDSLGFLEQAGLAVLGAGRNSRAAASPYVLNNDTLPVKVFGLASYGRERTGWNGADYAANDQTAGMLHAEKNGAELIKSKLDKNALNIIMFHGGIEYADYPDNVTRALYTELIHSGADLVIGTHPHVEQGFEWIDGKPVFWSLGDYVFNGMSNTPGGDKGIFIVLEYVGRRLVHINIYPVLMKGPRTIIMPPKQLERFYRLTKSLVRVFH